MNEANITCAGCKKVLPAAGIPHSGWIRHNGKDYCLSCQKKKKIGLWEVASAVALLLLTSCSSTYLQRIYEREAFYYVRTAVYVKHLDTGLCYLVGNSYRSMSATCVPCDSLKNVKVYSFHFNPEP